MKKYEFDGIKFIDESQLSSKEKIARKAEMDLFEEQVKLGDPNKALFEMIRSRQSRYPADYADQIRDDMLHIFSKAVAQSIVKQAKFAGELYAAATSANGDFFKMFERISALLKGQEVTSLVVLGLIAQGNNDSAEKVKKALDSQLSDRARAASDKGNAENRAMRDEAFRWLDKNFDAPGMTVDRAAEALQKIVPMEFSTRRGYVKAWKKSR
ncbi:MULTISPECIES: hypothetical protein [unclassified Caballeronia]|uniref:hypothetical protein n=1 Tax=unclassified Caballeronia TaxID=2646786 RepID=UPI00285C5B19|nr:MULTISPECIES: hypothetical protein [unclassified Caballeronia]MDR5770874.1 hypothetical protein [Caballeronia sp. LZ002]MDR5846311.1 hypothetical protein [Caballeronia sp. LZ003]